MISAFWKDLTRSYVEVEWMRLTRKMAVVEGSVEWPQAAATGYNGDIHGRG